MDKVYQYINSKKYLKQKDQEFEMIIMNKNMMFIEKINFNKNGNNYELLKNIPLKSKFINNEWFIENEELNIWAHNKILDIAFLDIVEYLEFLVEEFIINKDEIELPRTKQYREFLETYLRWRKI